MFVVGVVALVVASLTAAGLTVATVSPVGTAPVALSAPADPSAPGGGAPDEAPVEVPDEWDERVLFAVDFVEQHTGVPFEHPVAVEFLSSDAFNEALTGSSELTDEDRDEIEVSTGVLRGFGLISGDVDLLARAEELDTAAVAAYYDPKAKQVRVRGEQLDPLTRATVVHELVHAWQDQHHDLSRIDELGGEASATFRAVVEGDANEVAAAWVETLDRDDRREHDRAQRAAAASADVEGVPGIVTASRTAPYVFGPSLVKGIEVLEGRDGVDDALKEPPTASDALLSPWTFFDGSAARAVEPEPLPAGATEVGEPDVFGPLSLFLVLAELIDTHEALAVADDWAGDAHRTYRDEAGAVCTNTRFAAVNPGASDLTEQAWRDWDERLGGGQPGGADWVEVNRSGDDIVVVACDPGADAAIAVSDRVMVSIRLPMLRSQVWAVALGEGLDLDVARCMAVTYADIVEMQELASDEPLSASRVRELQEAAASC
jgi:hypothetical protein